MLINILFYALAAFWLLLALLLVVCVIVPHLTPKRPPTPGRELVEFADLLRSLPESSRMWVVEHLKLANAWTEHLSIEYRGGSGVIFRTPEPKIGPSTPSGVSSADVSEYEERSADGSLSVRWVEVGGPISKSEAERLRWVEQIRQECAELYEIEQFKTQHAGLMLPEMREIARRRIETAVQARYPDCRARFDWVTPPPVPVESTAPPTNFEG